MTRPVLRPLLVASLTVSVWGSAELSAQQDPPVAPAAPESLMAEEPETPEEQFEAVLLMLRLDRPDLARVYLQQFLATQPDDALLLSLRNTHGTSTFLRLSRVEELQPESQQMLQALQGAAARKFNDPVFFDSLLNQLEGDAREREAATKALRQLGADAVPGLLQRLGEGARIEQHNLLLYTLTQLGQSAVEPLLGALESPSERIRTLAIEALGWLGSEAIVPHLYYPAFGSDQSSLVHQAARRAIARILYDSADRTDLVAFNGVIDEVRQLAVSHFSGRHEWVPGVDGQIVIWSWDPELNQLVKTPTTAARASAFRAQRLAREAMSLSPERQDLRALFLAASLAESGYRAGWDQLWPIGPGTAHNLALFSGAELTEQALATALMHENAAAAVGALKALGQIASENLLRETAGREPAILAALDFPHDRVQFAAASAILQIDPTRRFLGARRVVEILARSLSDGGRRASVVIDPNSRRAANTAGVMRALGYEPSIAVTGRDGFRRASSQGDVALAVVHPNTIRWELTQTVANFRADARTAGIPLAIYGPQPLKSEVRRLLERTDKSKFIVTGGNVTDWQRQLSSLLAAVDVPPLTPEQRRSRIAAAAYWLRHIAEGQRTELYDLTPAEEALTGAIENPEIAADAVVALAAIPRASVQKRLAETVTAPALDIGVRELAGRQLAEHIRRFGRLLTEADIDALRSTWQSAEDPRISTALTVVFGTLGVTPSTVGAALQSHALSPRP